MNKQQPEQASLMKIQDKYKTSHTNDNNIIFKSKYHEADVSNNQQMQVGKKRIAIIGSGVSGLTCAHYLIDTYDVTIFEANNYIGGHVNTIDIKLTDKKKLITSTETSSIDTGFIVFNERTYPNFFRLLDELKVPFQKTDMSFSVKNPILNFEYNGHTLNSLLAQRVNVINPKFWRFAKDILIFNKQVKKIHNDYLKLEKDYSELKNQPKRRFQRKRNKRLAKLETQIHLLSQQTLGDYLEDNNYGSLFSENYLLPMVSAIWSMGLEESKEFPLIFFAQFFENHGLLDIVNRPQWFTIKGGSKQYVNKLIERFVAKGGKAHLNTPVQGVNRQISGVSIIYKQNNNLAANMDNALISEQFDEVIFACHADVSRKLLNDISTEETAILTQFTFTDNEAILHTDTSVLPKRSLAWASWNYLLESLQSTSEIESDTVKADMKEVNKKEKPILTYHMNILQRLVKKHNYLVTLNHNIDDAQIIKRVNYRHPIYNIAMTEAQKQWHKISGRQHSHFCGAYWFNGFHEDGVRSAIRVCQDLGINISNLNEVDSQHLNKNIEESADFGYAKIPYKADKNFKKLATRQVLFAKNNTSLNKLFAD